MKTIKIENHRDFECVADDMISEFMESLEGLDGFIREPDEDDGNIAEMVVFMYTDRAMRLYDNYVRRLTKIAERLFPDDDIEIKGSYVIFE